MKNSIWQKRIPTLLGIFFIVGGIAIMSLLIRNGIIVTTQASAENTPTQLRITNVTDTSFTVSYRTASKTLGTIAYGTDKNLGATALDDRDQTSSLAKPYTVHHITVRNTQPNTKYYFSITSGNSTFLQNGSLFEVTTGPSINDASSQTARVTGSVVYDTGQRTTEAIVYLTAPNSQTISTLLQDDGSYTLPLTTLRDKTLASYVLLSDTIPLQMLVLGDQGDSSVVFTMRQSNPVPLITLTKNYDFTVDAMPIQINPPDQNLQFPTLQTNEASPQKTPNIQSPQNNEGFVDQQPVFRGTAPANAEVQIEIHSSEEIQTNIKTDANGNWSYRPTQKLSPGEHTVTIKTRDQSGILQTITQRFTVHAEGSQVNQSATASATPTRPATITATPTPIQLEPTIPPTVVAISPTTEPIIPSPTIQGHQPIQNPGSTSLLITGIFAITATSIGFFLLFLSRGGSSA